jgi:hypothetical protein
LSVPKTQTPLHKTKVQISRNASGYYRTKGGHRKRPEEVEMAVVKNYFEGTVQ